jgi:N-acetylmuramoyl-L-alanine amidase
MSKFKLYLSASTQEMNRTADDRNEEYYMQKMAAQVALDLRNDCEIKLNQQEWTLRQVINDSNAWKPDFHLALHTNAMPKPGSASGTECWIHNDSIDGNRMADILIKKVTSVLGTNIRGGKEDPNTKETGVDGGKLAELDDTHAPACLIEIVFHDNPKDLEKLKTWWNETRRAIAESVREYIRLYGAKS